MVEMMSWTPVAVFRVLDREGQPIGEVVQPKTAPVVGRGARTVLLVRGSENGDGLSDQHWDSNYHPEPSAVHPGDQAGGRSL